MLSKDIKTINKIFAMISFRAVAASHLNWVGVGYRTCGRKGICQPIFNMLPTLLLAKIYLRIHFNIFLSFAPYVLPILAKIVLLQDTIFHKSSEK